MPDRPYPARGRGSRIGRQFASCYPSPGADTGAPTLVDSGTNRTPGVLAPA